MDRVLFLTWDGSRVKWEGSAGLARLNAERPALREG
jgi:hypothetical protein